MRSTGRVSETIQRSLNLARLRLHAPGWHREAIGGLWDVMGPKQLEFLREQGLRTDHYFLDVGCGALRAGVHLARYLDPGHYFGLDIDHRVLRAGRRELEAAGLTDRRVTLLDDNKFRFGRFGRTFDMAIAQSVFTHLPMNVIMRCLGEMEGALSPGGRFYATFFSTDNPRLSTDPVTHRDSSDGSEFVTYMDADGFHYDPDVFRWAVDGSSLDWRLIGDWGHPRNQQMMVFTKAGPDSGAEIQGKPVQQT